MTKKHMIALAQMIKDHRKKFSDEAIFTMADWMTTQNPAFKRDRWLGFIAGTNGPNGGSR
jgi:hypothetical protein